MEEPTFDKFGDPTNETLATIQTWHCADWIQLVNFIEQAWNHTYGQLKRYEDKVCFVTGGWSANEQIIGALHDNLIINSLYWLSSHRGGEYWYSLHSD